jgi:hypothetical protein
MGYHDETHRPSTLLCQTANGKRLLLEAPRSWPTMWMNLPPSSPLPLLDAAVGQDQQTTSTISRKNRLLLHSTIGVLDLSASPLRLERGLPIRCEREPTRSPCSQPQEILNSSRYASYRTNGLIMRTLLGLYESRRRTHQASLSISPSVGTRHTPAAFVLWPSSRMPAV